MSNYYIKAKSKISDKEHKFLAIDDYFGRHIYGYKDIDSGIVFNKNEFEKIYDNTEHIDIEVPTKCNYSEHNPPTSRFYKDGIYEHTCEKCCKKQVFRIINPTL